MTIIIKYKVHLALVSFFNHIFLSSLSSFFMTNKELEFNTSTKKRATKVICILFEVTLVSRRLSRKTDYPPLNGPWGVKHGKIISHISICYQHIVFHGCLQKYGLVNFNWVFLISKSKSILKISQFKNIYVSELNTYVQVFTPPPPPPFMIMINNKHDC